MKVTPLHEAVRNYVTKCTAAFLQEKQNLKWIRGVLLQSGLNREETSEQSRPRSFHLTLLVDGHFAPGWTRQGGNPSETWRAQTVYLLVLPSVMSLRHRARSHSRKNLAYLSTPFGGKEGADHGDNFTATPSNGLRVGEGWPAWGTGAERSKIRGRKGS